VGSRGLSSVRSMVCSAVGSRDLGAVRSAVGSPRRPPRLTDTDTVVVVDELAPHATSSCSGRARCT
jgi:hypothetical protein